MVPEPDDVRRRRSDASPGEEPAPAGDGAVGWRPVVAVTGAAGGLGEAFAARLIDHPDVRKVIAVDATRGPLRRVTWRLADVRDPVLASRLEGVDVVVHLALDLDVDGDPGERSALNVAGTGTVLAAAAAAHAGRVVVVTSAMVYGAHADNPVPIPDSAPIRAVPEGSLLADYVEIERVVDEARRGYPGLELTVLRPATLVGPGADGVVTRHFEAPRLLVVKGHEPSWQFCHVDDLLAALEHAALGRVSGVANVACEGWLSQAEVEDVSGLRRIELPAAVAYGAAARLHRLGVTPAPASDLAYLMHPWVVSCEALRAAGWAPSYDNSEALRAQLAESDAERRRAIASRRIDRRDATRAAAGAAVAVVGTAALLRQARRRRHG